MRLEVWSTADGETKRLDGALEWKRGQMVASGDAAWLLDGFHAVLPGTDGKPRGVHHDEGDRFLLAVYFSLRSTYAWPALVDDDGQHITPEEAMQLIDREMSPNPGDSITE